MKYKGWNLEKTLLISSTSPQARPSELIDVYVTIDTVAADNLANAIRVVSKPAWNIVGDELPSQVYNIQKHGETTTFRVAFLIDLPANSNQRVGILYDNPTAPKPVYESDLVTGIDNGTRYVENYHYRIDLDPASWQPRNIKLKLHVLEYTHPRLIAAPAQAQPGARVLLSRQGSSPLWLSAADWRKPEVRFESGPLFVLLICSAPLSLRDDPTATDPILEMRYKFLAGQPHILCSSHLRFTADTPVFGIEHDIIAAAPDRFSHYCFRPVTPSLPDTDVEEVGHVLVDQEHIRGIPDGAGFGGFLPHDLAWHGFISCIRQPDFRFDYAWTSLRLAESSSPGSPTYRAATYLGGSHNELQASRKPIHVNRLDRLENITWVPKDSSYHHSHLWHFGEWDEKKKWLNHIDSLGRRLNLPPKISQHPVFLGQPAPPEPYELLPVGQNSEAYTKAGIR